MWTKLRGFRSEKSLKNKGLMTFVGFVYVGNVDEDTRARMLLGRDPHTSCAIATLFGDSYLT